MKFGGEDVQGIKDLLRNFGLDDEAIDSLNRFDRWIATLHLGASIAQMKILSFRFPLTKMLIGGFCNVLLEEARHVAPGDLVRQAGVIATIVQAFAEKTTATPEGPFPK